MTEQIYEGPFGKVPSWIPPETPSGVKAQAIQLDERVNDLERCLRGDQTSKRWQELNVELTNKKQELLFMKRRLAGRTPQMASWADPL